MDEENISIQTASVAVSTTTEGKFILDRQEGTFSARHAADHNEIIIMQNDWDEICRKAKAINLKKQFDWISLLWGVAIPYVLEAINNYRQEKATDYFPLALCFLLIALLKGTQIRNPFKCKIKLSLEPKEGSLELGNSSDNVVHHDDLIKTLDRISYYLEKQNKQKTEVS